MGTVLSSDPREDTFEGKKMLFSVLSASLLVLAAGSALPEERISCSFPPGTCMAWTWSSVSGCKCTKEVNIAPVDLDKFRQDSLTAHNAYRAKHGVPALKLNDELNDVAQEWADYLMAVDGFEHRHPNKYGENLYMSSGRAAQEHRELLIVGTLRSRTTPSEENQAVADLSLGISPRWCGREALRLELVWHRKAARSSWWRTTLRLATTLDNMLTTSSLHSRFEVKRITLEMEESDWSTPIWTMP